MKAKIPGKISGVILSLLIASSISAADGMVNVQSSFSVQETVNRLERILEEKGMTLFARIDHSGGASNAGMELRDTELLIFGNPKIGSKLMRCQQSIAIDLPQKLLVWKDENSDVWISFNDPAYLATRHELAGCEEIIQKINGALLGISRSAAE